MVPTSCKNGFELSDLHSVFDIKLSDTTTMLQYTKEFKPYWYDMQTLAVTWFTEVYTGQSYS